MTAEAFPLKRTLLYKIHENVCVHVNVNAVLLEAAATEGKPKRYGNRLNSFWDFIWFRFQRLQYAILQFKWLKSIIMTCTLVRDDIHVISL